MANIFACQNCGKYTCIENWMMGEYPYSWQLLVCNNCGSFAVLVNEVDGQCDEMYLSDDDSE